MSDPRSAVLFWLACIPTRALLVYLAYAFEHSQIDDKYRLPFLGLVLFIGLPFFYRYLSGTRQSGPETFGRPIWWNTLRPIHGLIYTVFAVLFYYRVKGAYVLLLLDLCIGIYAELFLKKH
jgi:hypothetical protein